MAVKFPGIRRRAVPAGPGWAVAPLYEWFMPLLHLDARSDLVQCIKLCEHLIGRGSPLTRPPRLPLEGAERARVESIMNKALTTRPELPVVGLKSRATAQARLDTRK